MTLEQYKKTISKAYLDGLSLAEYLALDDYIDNIQAVILDCIDLLGKSGENTKAIVAKKLRGVKE